MNSYQKYLKYKNKYLQLKNKINISQKGGIPSIEMDGSIFQLKGNYVDNDKSNYALLRQTTRIGGRIKIYNFMVYRSMSQGGFWRLCMKTEGTSSLRISQIAFYKGEFDYTCQSLIKIELQIYINKNIDSVPQLTGPTVNCNRYYTDNLNLLINKSDQYDIEDTFPYNVSNNPKRKVSLNNIFDEMVKELECGRIETNGTLGVSKIGLYFESMPSLFSVTKIEYIDKWIYKVNYENHRLDIDGRIHKYVFNNGLFLYVLHYNINVYKKQEDVYHLDYERKNMYFPIILTTSSNSITYGLYEHYITTEVYTCKLFDFHYQVNDDEKKLYNQFQLGSKKNDQDQKFLNYVGDRYNNVYPFNKYPLPPISS
jgi:hypothetical protein